MSGLGLRRYAAALALAGAAPGAAALPGQPAQAAGAVVPAALALVPAALAPSRLPQDTPAPAQEAGPRTVVGRVVRPAGRASDEPQPVAGVQVTLHRIGTDGAGPLDSLRTGRDGSYRFRYRATGAADALYVVSAEHHGIAYFAPALRDTDVRGDDAEIVVFDTTSAPVPIRVRARHVIVSAAVDGERQVFEVYELVNDTSVTLVPGARERAVWTAVVPETAHDFAVPPDQGIAQSAVQLLDGRVLLFAPFTPGIRQLAFTYHLPIDAFPVRLPMERETAMLEVLLEEPNAKAAAPRLVESDPVTVEGRTFRRFVADEVPASAVLVLDVPAQPVGQNRLVIFVVVLAIGVVMLIVLARSFARRAPAAARAPPRVPSAVLEQRLAALDAAFARLPNPTDEAREAYMGQRAAMVAERDAALAREERGR